MVNTKFRILVLAAVAFAFAAVQSPAGAVIPVVDQYTEQFPNPGGNSGTPGQGGSGGSSPSNPTGGNGNGNGGQVGSGGVSDGLDGTSDDGSVGAAGTGSDRGGPGGSDPAADVNSLPDGTVASVNDPAETQAAIDSVSASNDGMGWMFPLLIALAVGAAVAVVLARRRSESKSTS